MRLCYIAETHHLDMRLRYIIYQRRTLTRCVSAKEGAAVGGRDQIPETHHLAVRLWYSKYQKIGRASCRERVLRLV